MDVTILNCSKRLEKALYGAEVDMTPVASFTQTGITSLMEKSGAHWPNAHSDPNDMAQLAISGYTIAGFESIRVPFCLTVLAEALGCEVDLGSRNRLPTVVAHPIKSDIGIPSQPEGLLDSCRIPAVFDTISIIKDLYGKSVPIIAGLEGPITLASDLIGAERFLISFIKNPKFVSEVIEFATGACIAYAKGLACSGADVLCVADPVSSPELISPKMFDNYAKGNLIELSKSIKGQSVLHICGNVFKIIGSMSECGYTALSIEEKVNDLQRARGLVGDRARLVGNVACATTLFNGTPSMVKSEATHILREGIAVLAPGCGLAPETPLENVMALRSSRDEFFG